MIKLYYRRSRNGLIFDGQINSLNGTDYKDRLMASYEPEEVNWVCTVFPLGLKSWVKTSHLQLPCLTFSIIETMGKITQQSRWWCLWKIGLALKRSTIQ